MTATTTEIMQAEMIPLEQPANLPATTTPRSVEARIEANKRVIGLLAPELSKHHLLNLKGNTYMKVAGGIALAQALGFTISVGDVERSEDADGAWLACRAELKDALSGLTLAEATGYVGFDEPRWAKAPRYARMSMCQTRAIAKLCRSNFGAMYTLLGATRDTPAEEMEAIYEEPQQATQRAAQAAPAAITEPPQPRNTPATRAAPAAREGFYGDAVNIDGIEEKTTSAGKPYLRIKPAGGRWMSCFDSDSNAVLIAAGSGNKPVELLIETHPKFGDTVIGARPATSPAAEDIPF